MLEIAGGGLFLVGLFTRPVAFILSGEMAFAYFIGHASQGFWPVLNQGTPAILFCFLVAAAGCDLSRREIPLSLTVTGTLIGLMLSVLLPWPWPNGVSESLPHVQRLGIDEWWLLLPTEMQKLGLYPWPVWGPLPRALPPGRV